MKIRLASIFRRLTRTRPANTSDGLEPKEGLKKCLSTMDLVSLGVGSCCGTGMYLTCGMITKTAGGLGAVIAFLVAGLASFLSGVCYAELAALCPKTSGSAYMYSYVTVGELIAYIIGWGLIAEYAIGTAAGAVALSATIDSICNFTFSTYFSTWGNIGGRPYFDLLAVLICLVLTIVLVSGVKLSATVNNILNLVNFIVWIFFLGVSIHYSDGKNWNQDKRFPTGTDGVLKMLPTAYFAFIGFDIVASTGEEAKNPSKSIPRSIILSVIINVIAYTSVSTCLSLIIPANQLMPQTAMLDVFVKRKAFYAKYIISCGAVCGLFAAAFGSMFPLPRVLCAMAKDGLLFSQFGEICPKRKTPKTATVLTGVVAILLALTVDLAYLIELVLMGTLLAYILVAVSVIVLRYSNEEIDESLIESSDSERMEGANNQKDKIIRNRIGTDNVKLKDIDQGKKFVAKETFFSKFEDYLRKERGSFTDYVPVIVFVILILQVIICIVIVNGMNHLVNSDVPVITTLAILVSLLFILVGFLAVLPQSKREQSFRVSCVPIIPLLVTFLNIYFMASLTVFSWTLFTIWMAIGFVVYFTYSIRQKGGVDYTRLSESSSTNILSDQTE
ncbi:hypothetical protein SNE40_013864 [Patella caerulea]|uniref:Cationic amino acid transporter n=1 Tax=Patella caerulea TaxID=87958 RepID=A0AAN8PBP9_PATCE